MRVDVLLVDGMFDTGLTATLDTLAIANELAESAGMPAPFRVSMRGVRSRVTTQLGFRIAVERPEDAPDLAILPALGAKTPDALASSLARSDVRQTAELLVRYRERGARLAAACTGTYVMASSGVLDGSRATTTWWLAADFRARFPRVCLEESAMVADEGDLVTAGAALAHVDLALWIVRQSSPELAETTARYLLVDARASQATYAMQDHLAHNDPLVRKFEAWARDHLRDFTMAAACRALGTTDRTLQRRVRSVLGRTPIAFVQDLRAQQATHMLRTTDASIDDVARAVGYADPVTVRQLLRARTGRTAGQLRRS